jgi:hypothetical protein
MLKASLAKMAKEPGVVVTILIVAVILVSYVVGSLTSSVEIEKELPHHY